MTDNDCSAIIEEACKTGFLDRLAEEYIFSCCILEKKENEDDNEKKKSKLKKARFPNLAGFCRYIGISTSELEAFGKSNPCEYSMILTVLEDEALNSGISPALLSAYLKKRLGYDSAKIQESSSQLEIKFEHDIFEDGA